MTMVSVRLSDKEYTKLMELADKAGGRTNAIKNLIMAPEKLQDVYIDITKHFSSKTYTLIREYITDNEPPRITYDRACYELMMLGITHHKRLKSKSARDGMHNSGGGGLE